MFASVQPAAADPILGLTEAFLADTRPDKVNLGIGIYKDENGQTPTLAAVREAEARILAADSPKGYLPITGTPAYGQLSRQLLFGLGHDLVESDRVVTTQTPGGTGGLRVVGDFIAQHNPEATLWLSTPTWANHPAIFAAAGVKTQGYRYYDASSQAIDWSGLLEDLQQIKAGDVVLLHGCCHNPTGVDLASDQWQQVATLIEEKQAIALVDFAYQGFGDGLEQDAQGLRTVAGICSQFIVCASYSKNFGLYNERVGATTFVCPDAHSAKSVGSQVKVAIRRNYSNPPAHGGQIVQTILSDEALTAQWQDELAIMRGRINGVRQDLAQALDQVGVKLSPEGNAFLTKQKGMFGFSGLTSKEVAALKDDHAIYMVASGRINVAGIQPARLEKVAQAIKAVRG